MDIPAKNTQASTAGLLAHCDKKCNKGEFNKFAQFCTFSFDMVVVQFPVETDCTEN